MAFLVQANVQTWAEDRPEQGCDFHSTILDCRLNQELKGMTLDNDFEQLLETVIASL